MFKWWSKCISMVIAKTASRNVIYKANKLGESMFVRQSEMLIPEEELGSQSPVSYEEDFEDLSSNVDLYMFLTIRWFKVIEELTSIADIMRSP